MKITTQSSKPWLAFVLALSEIRSTWAGIPTAEVDVAIIGGGSAGSYAAISLFDQNKTVSVIEPTGKLGGHVNTYVDEATGTTINAGVQAFTLTPIVQAYYKRLGVPLDPVVETPGAQLYVDFATGRIESFSLNQSALGAALQTYGGILESNYSYLENGYYLPDPVPEDLLLPFGDFANKYDLDAAVYVMNLQTQPNVIYKETALYTLKQFDLNILAALADPSMTVSGDDLSRLYTSAADILGDSVLFNSTVESVQRTASDGATLLVNTPKGQQIIKASKILFTAPPLLSNLLGWDLSLEELTLFSKLQPYGYMAGVIRNTGIPSGTTLSNVGMNSSFNVPSLPGISVIEPSSVQDTYLAFVGSEPPLPVALAQAQVVEQLARVAASAGWEGGEKTDIFAWYDHTPVKLHVSAEQIAEGFYKDLYGLQGSQSTWYTGAAWMSQASPPIWQYTQGVLATMFPGCNLTNV
jgi:hypothetical protein